MNNSNPFGRPLPVLVLLRNCQFAVVHEFVEVGAFHMQGRGPFITTGEALEFCAAQRPDQTPLATQLWRGDNARWREDNLQSPLDIIAVVTRDAATGECTYTAVARAAGAQKKEAA
jgi:hypothetical protein